jgi:hypothetical protein
VIPIADALSGDTPITITFGLLALAGFGAYVAEKVSTRYRIAALERADESHAAAQAACVSRVGKLETDVLGIKMTLHPPPRSGSYPGIQIDDR